MFSFSLTKCRERKKLFDHGFNTHELDDIDLIDLLSFVCKEVEDCQLANFYVSGFGEEDWGVDEAFDLLSIVEQIPDFLESFKSLKQGELDFCEQGQQRILDFRRESEVVIIKCQSYSVDWQPSPDSEKISLFRFYEIFELFISTFISLLKENFPHFFNSGKLEKYKNLLPLV